MKPVTESELEGEPTVGPNGEPLLVRVDWISASQFHPVGQEAVLREVSERVRKVLATRNGSKGHPLVVLDLDSTLYEVAPRTYRIVLEWTEGAESAQFSEIAAALAKLPASAMGYSLRDTFRTAGFSLDEPMAFRAWESLKKFWVKRFFRSDYLKYDRPYPGASDFAKKLHEIGAEILYLTGRDEPNMGEGTRRNLIRDGFPWEVERTHLMMKPAIEISDLDHKKSAAEFIKKRGELIASFENEPVNLVALYEIFPEAMHVFVDTVCSDRGAKAINGLYRVQGFE
jgi:hypothetical protein